MVICSPHRSLGQHNQTPP